MGQNEFELFKELTGHNWFDDAQIHTDPETKITEFDWENYIDPELIDPKLVGTPEFKKMIKILNYTNRTKYEALQEEKENFKKLMPILSGLTRDEQYALIHKMKNQGRKHGDNFTDELLTEMVFKYEEKKLAKISEEEHFNQKNRYRLQRKTLDFAEKKRMPVDEAKLKDVLRNRTTFKNRIVDEIGNYDQSIKNPQFEYGVLTYLNEASYGEMRDLVRDVGVHTDNMEFFNVGDLQKKRESMFVH